MGIQDLLDSTLVATGTAALHRGHLLGEVLQEDELRAARHGVAAVVDADDLECGPDELIGGELGDQFGHAAGSLTDKLRGR